jgi:tRNA threonylcarbamoyl adenosine modification protein (Sua5/YciO/YrdC/YwlC family)
MIIEWDPERPRRKATELIKTTLMAGGIVVYPTDTIYGMGCDLFNIKAIRRLYAMKHLDGKKALTVICRDFKDVITYAVVSDHVFDMMKRCLPGPYTFVLVAKRIMPKLLMTPKKEVGVRVPDHPVPVAVARLIERPVINTSAKFSGGEILSDPRVIEREFKGSVDLIVDGGILAGEPSTVIRVDDSGVEVLREGKGPLKDLLRG